MATVTADDRRRIVLPDARPGDRFDLSKDSEGRIILRQLKPSPEAVEADVRTVKISFDERGMPYLRGVKVSRESIAQAVRDDRDSR